MKYDQVMTLLQQEYRRTHGEVRSLVYGALTTGQSFFTVNGERYRVSRDVQPDSWTVRAVRKGG